MTENVYAPPQAAVADHASEQAPFYVVAPWKFWLLFAATLGFYQYYWMYRHWALQRARTGEAMWPIARGIFAVFFAHGLFGRIQHHADRVGVALRWSPAALATAYVVLLIAARVFDRLAKRGIWEPNSSTLAVTLLLPLGWTLARAQQAANAACGDPRGTSNARLTGANLVWLALGAVLWSLTVLGFAVLFGLVEV